MTGLKKQTMARVWTELAILFDKEVSEVKMEALWNTFESWSEEDFLMAAKTVKETCRFMPTIADFYEAIRIGL